MSTTMIEDSGDSTVWRQSGCLWPIAGSVLFVIAGLGLAGWIWFTDTADTPQLLTQARLALDQQDFHQAEMIGLRLAKRRGVESQGWLIAGEAADRQGQFDVALQYYLRVPTNAGKMYHTALVGCGDMVLEQHQLARAEDYYLRVLAADPTNLVAHDRLAILLGIEGRNFEAAEHRLELIRNHQFSANHLVLLAMAERTVENRERMERFRRETPDDPRALCGPVREALRENRLVDAGEMLTRILQQNPNLLQAQAWQGALLIAEAKDDAFLAWQAALPAAAEQFPEIWRHRGDWAQAHGESRVAIRCYWEAARLDPNSQPAHYQLARLLAAEGESAQAQPFLHRAQLLEELVVAARRFHGSDSREASVLAAQLTEKLGLYWESLGWNEISLDQSPPSEANRRTMDRLASEAMRESAARTPRSEQPARQINLSAYPLPKWGRPDTKRVHRDGGDPPSASPIAFSDLAATAQVHFVHISGGKPGANSSYYYEHNGGGAAVLDYDNDGWPDLYFTQGSAWPLQSDQRQDLDRLYRNLSGRRFADVTSEARLIESGFSQGVTVGDYDNDGFADLYVCNLGANRLFHNNGDGTFRDVTDEANVAGDCWSASCVMADLNGDRWPDLYVVNYLAGDHLFDYPCQFPDGRPRLCTPHEFPAAQDQLYLNLGDGHFSDESTTSGIEAPDGKGLGIVAADFDDSGRISLFVANDATLNFFFKNKTLRPGDPPQFAEEGLVSGLAVDAEGRSQACMGVAAGDADGDQRLDLFVTNFRDESNTLYVQPAVGQFLDQTRRAGLRDPSYAMVGFGTQFLDADLDGLLDLVLTNGHVGDMSRYGEPYEMPPQFFRNVGGGRFVELPAKSLGPFFQGKYLGRALARVDWNRDGLDDFVINHLASPAAVVTNQTRRAGHFLALRLRGVTSARDAIGATAVLTAGDRVWTAQLTAGDGYQASNERILRFGLGEQDQIDRVEIRWPTGAKQTIESPSVDTELIVIEGQEETRRLPPPRSDP